MIQLPESQPRRSARATGLQAWSTRNLLTLVSIFSSNAPKRQPAHTRKLEPVVMNLDWVVALRRGEAEVITMTPILIQVQHLCFYLFNLALLDKPCKPYTYTHRHTHTHKKTWSECTVNGVLNSTRPGSSGGNSGAVVRTGSVRKHAAMQVETTQFWKFALTLATFEAALTIYKDIKHTLYSHL